MFPTKGLPTMKKTYVLDTNVILHSAQSLNAFEDNEVVIP